MKREEVTHADIFEKLTEHEGKIVSITSDVRGIKETLTPIANGVRSMAWSFKALLALGAIAAVGVGFVEFWEALTHVSDHVHPE